MLLKAYLQTPAFFNVLLRRTPSLYWRIQWTNCNTWLSTRISSRRQTRAMRCITANVLQTNEVDAQCNKLVIELSWQCFALKVANLQLAHLHLAPPLGFTPFEFRQDFRHQKTRVPGLSCDPMLSHFSNNNNNNNNPICKAPECQKTSVALVEHQLVADRQTDNDS